MCFTSVVSIVAFLLICCVESQEVSLNRTTPSGMLSVCPHSFAVFTCRTTGSITIAWRSTEYITDVLGFTSSDAQGTINREPNDVVATLTLKSGNVLESELRIRARVNSTIRCLPDDVRNEVAISLVVYNGFEIPGKPTDVAATEIPGADDSCTILVDWDPPADTPPEDISHYIVRDSINGVQNETNTSTQVTFLLSECTSSLFVNISTVDHCGREGPSSANIRPNFLPPTNVETSPGQVGTPEVRTIVGIVLGSLAIALCAIILVIILAFFCWKRWRRNRPVRNQGDDATDCDEAQFNLKAEMSESDVDTRDEPVYSNDQGLLEDKTVTPLTEVDEKALKKINFFKAVNILIVFLDKYGYRAACKYMKPVLRNKPYLIKYGTSMTIGTFAGHYVVMVHAERGSKYSCSIKEALQAFPNTKAIIATGIAHGVSRENCSVAVGDVLVSEIILGYANNKNASKAIMVSSESVFQNMLKEAFAWRGQQNGLVCTRGGRKAKTHCCTIASSSLFAKDINYLIKFAKQNTNIIGGETEGYDLIKIQENLKSDVGVMIVKGISEFTETKYENWEATAAMAAAHYIHEILDQNPLLFERANRTQKSIS